MADEFEMYAKVTNPDGSLHEVQVRLSLEANGSVIKNLHSHYAAELVDLGLYDEQTMTLDEPAFIVFERDTHGPVFKDAKQPPPPTKTYEEVAVNQEIVGK